MDTDNHVHCNHAVGGDRGFGLDRRTFLKFAVGAPAAASLGVMPRLAAQARPDAPAKAVIVLWMSGGPSQMDTWDLKPGQKTGGLFRETDTSVRGIRISEHLPRLAQQAHRYSIIRTLTHDEAAHERGTHLMHTCYAPIEGQPFAPMGTVVSHERAPEDFPLPTHVVVSASGSVPLSDVFGERHLPFTIDDMREPIPNLRARVGDRRDKARQDLLEDQDDGFGEDREGREMVKRRESADKAREMMTSDLLKAFDLNQEPEAVRNKFGGDFGQKCLLARRLVEAGVPFVEVGLGGWDNHNNVFDRVKQNSARLGEGMAALLEDMGESGLLDETIVVWAGEFGRTPIINGSKGRDHWTRSMACVVAGGGIQGGRVIGRTEKDGMDIESRPVTVPELFASVYQQLGIDPRMKYEINTRPLTVAYGGRPMRDLF